MSSCCLGMLRTPCELNVVLCACNYKLQTTNYNHNLQLHLTAIYIIQLTTIYNRCLQSTIDVYNLQLQPHHTTIYKTNYKPQPQSAFTTTTYNRCLQLLQPQGLILNGHLKSRSTPQLHPQPQPQPQTTTTNHNQQMSVQKGERIDSKTNAPKCKVLRV